MQWSYRELQKWSETSLTKGHKFDRKCGSQNDKNKSEVNLEYRKSGSSTSERASKDLYNDMEMIP